MSKNDNQSMYITVFIACYCATALGQQIGNRSQENHPPLFIQACTKTGGCQLEKKSVVVDSNWRWTHVTTGTNNCYTGNTWDTSICPNGPTCAQNCALDGADYQNSYGIISSNTSLSLHYVTNNTNASAGSRIYLLDSETRYKVFFLKNREFTFDVDVSKLPCGLNGALYFVEMDTDGGMSKYPGNKAGAKYGTGYCDAQCPHDLKFINGEANCEDWKPSATDKNSGTGKYGSCCNELDIWEANSYSTAYNSHVCIIRGQMRYDKDAGVCDKDGCDFNPYRLGDKSFFGLNSTILNTTQPFTVVTQFITNDGTDEGNLFEIRRIWIQNGKTIQTRNVTVDGRQYNSITDRFCDAQKFVFGDKNTYGKMGGNQAMGGSLDRGMILVISLRDDYENFMLWLDSDYPPNVSPSQPGVARGTCPTTLGRPSDVETHYPGASVTYSNIKYGEIGTTVN